MLEFELLRIEFQAIKVESDDGECLAVLQSYEAGDRGTRHLCWLDSIRYGCSTTEFVRDLIQRVLQRNALTITVDTVEMLPSRN